MALETLKGIAAIDGEKIRVMPGGSAGFIMVNYTTNTVAFTLQNGPIKENGKNGCQVDSLITVAKRILIGFYQQLPSHETSDAITKLDEALHHLDKRTRDREGRGVEGTNNP